MNLENDRDYLDYCRVKAGMDPAVGWQEHMARILGSQNYWALRTTEWCPEFEEAMRNRLIFGAPRYGLLKNLKRRDFLGSLEKRIAEYRRTGNTEMLVDAANCLLLEFVLAGGMFAMKPIEHNDALDMSD